MTKVTHAVAMQAGVLHDKVVAVTGGSGGVSHLQPLTLRFPLLSERLYRTQAGRASTLFEQEYGLLSRLRQSIGVQGLCGHKQRCLDNRVSSARRHRRSDRAAGRVFRRQGRHWRCCRGRRREAGG